MISLFINRIVIGIGVFLLPLIGFSQDQDFQIWSGVEVNYKWNKKLSFALEQNLRTAHNSLLVGKTFTELKVNYDLPKKMTITGGYRFFQLYIGEKSLRHRLFADFKYSYKLDRIKFKYRLRYQNQTSKEKTSNTFRNQFKIAYNLPKTSIEPFLAGESYYTFFRGFEKYRMTVGLYEKFGKKFKGSIYYRYQREVNYTNVETQNIVGISLSYDLGKRKKKKDQPQIMVE
jgi:hypothetical protein